MDRRTDFGNARGLDEDWVRQLRAGRTGPLEEIRRALAGEDPDAACAALLALARVRDLDLPVAGIHELILPWLESPIEALRGAAPRAVVAVEPGRLAVGGFERMARDESPFVRSAVGDALVEWAGAEIRGRAEEVCVSLLDDPADRVRESALRSLRGVHAGEALQAKVVDLTAGGDADRALPAVRLGLTWLLDKSPATLDRLLSLATFEGNGDKAADFFGEEAGTTAALALKHGVPVREPIRAVDALLRRLDASDPPLTRLREILEVVALYGVAAHESWLERLAAREGRPDTARRLHEETIDRVKVRSALNPPRGPR